MSSCVLLLKKLFTLVLFLVCASAVKRAEAATLLAVDSANQIVSINTTTGVGSLVGTFTNAGGAPVGLGWANNDLFILTGYSGGAANAQPLIEVDPTTGVQTGVTVGLGLTAAGVAALSQGDFVLDGTQGFIASATQKSGGFSATLGALYSVNTATNSTTTINGASTPKFDGLALNSSGTLYGLSRETGSPATDSLYTINTSTGVATLVGGTGISDATLSAFAGLAFAADGTLFGVVGNTISSQLYSINPGTGVATAIGSGVGFGAVDGIVFSVDPAAPTPEPGTFVLGACGLIALAWRQRRTSRS